MENKRSEITNSFWLISEKLIKLVGQLLVGVVLARALGSEMFGQLNYTISFVYIFFSLSALGMENVLVKFIIERPGKLSETISTAFVMRTIAGLVFFATALLLGKLYFFSGEDAALMLPFALMLLQVVFQPFDVFRLYFQSKLRSHIPSLSLTIAYAIAIAVRVYYAYHLNFSMIAFSYALEVMLYGVIVLFNFSLLRAEPFRFSFNWQFCKELWRRTAPMLITSFFYLIYIKADQIMLGKMSTDSEVAYFSVASRLSESWYFIPVAIVNSIFPSIVRFKNENREQYLKKLKTGFLLLSTISTIIAIITVLTAYPLITFLYGMEYASSSWILMIHIWSGVFVFSGVLAAAWMINEEAEKILSVFTIAGAFVSVGMNFLLIPYLGGLGVAITAFITKFLVSYFLSMLHPKTREVFVLQTKGYIDTLSLKGFSIIFRSLKQKRIHISD